MRIVFTQLKFICSFCLEAKEPKIQDLETPAKNQLYALKILNLRELGVYSLFLVLCRASDSRIFLTFAQPIFLTPAFPRSVYFIDTHQQC